MQSTKPIAITVGDHRGIGSEVISKGLSILKKNHKISPFVIIGDPSLFRPFNKILPYKKHRVVFEKDLFSKDKFIFDQKVLNFIIPDLSSIQPKLRDSYSCGRYIKIAHAGIKKGLFSALVTAPVDKFELHRGGHKYDGHTEFLQSLDKAKSVTMMLASNSLRVSLVTTHVPINKVPSLLTVKKIKNCIHQTVVGLMEYFKINSPRIAVLSLNPHAGDRGLFGSEEYKIIRPALIAYKKSNPKVQIYGPFSADGFFARWSDINSRKFDAVICMYHDQGLIPIKLLDFKNTVNITLGLSFVRTSVDHGIGLDIAGKNVADPSSFCAAFLLARSTIFLKK